MSARYGGQKKTTGVLDVQEHAVLLRVKGEWGWGKIQVRRVLLRVFGPRKEIKKCRSLGLRKQSYAVEQRIWGSAVSVDVSVCEDWLILIVLLVY